MLISQTDPAETPGSDLAVMAEVLFLANLLLIPGLGFLLLVRLYLKHTGKVPPLAQCHLQQTFSASIWGGLLLVLITGLVLVMGGLDWEWTWVVVVLYFTTVHSTLIMLGIVGVSRAMAGRGYRYPLVGSRLCCLNGECRS